jgi:hypothetical protein
MQKQPVTGLLLAGVILAYLIGSPRAMAGQVADTPRQPISPRPAAKEAAIGVTTLALDVSQAYAGTRGGRAFVAFPLVDGGGFALSQQIGMGKNGVAAHKVGSADDKGKDKPPPPGRVPEPRPRQRIPA